MCFALENIEILWRAILNRRRNLALRAEGSASLLLISFVRNVIKPLTLEFKIFKEIKITFINNIQKALKNVMYARSLGHIWPLDLKVVECRTDVNFKCDCFILSACAWKDNFVLLDISWITLSWTFCMEFSCIINKLNVK